MDYGNKIPRTAKANSDVTLQYLGDLNNISFVTYADDAYANRDDLSSQGGYLLCMVNRTVTAGDEGRYNLNSCPCCLGVWCVSRVFVFSC